MQLYSVQLIPGKAEITGDKGMYPRASGGLSGPQTLAWFHKIITYSSCIYMYLCTFILPLRNNMITHSITMIFFFLHLVKNKSRSKFRSREKVDLNSFYSL